ncbi:MAG: hypothetical protein LBV28_03340, partial [Puniceicoccales bacterium]|nr:hypothetical protein [Puniceicoccales bacterium]
MFANIVLTFLVVLIGAVGARADAAGKWTQEAYVWQRQHGDSVASAMQTAPAGVAGFCVLAVEVSWHETQFPQGTIRTARIVRIPLDYVQLAATGKLVGLALRVGVFGGAAGDYARTGAAAKTLAALAAEMLAAARASGLTPAELQVDF